MTQENVCFQFSLFEMNSLRAKVSDFDGRGTINDILYVNCRGGDKEGRGLFNVFNFSRDIPRDDYYIVSRTYAH